MGQTITYKTKYKSLNAIKKVLDKLVGQGAFGKDVKVCVKGDAGFYKNCHHCTRDPNTIFNVSFPYEAMGDRDFAVTLDPETKQISLVFDEKNSKHIADARGKIDALLKSGTMLDRVVNGLKDKSVSMKVNKTSDTEWSVEVEFTEEQLKQYKANQ